MTTLNQKSWLRPALVILLEGTLHFVEIMDIKNKKYKEFRVLTTGDDPWPTDALRI